MFEHHPDKKLKFLGWALHGAGLVLTLAIAGLGYALGLRPMDAEIAACQSRAQELEGRLADAAKVRGEHGEVTRAAAAMEETALALERRVPKEPSEADFLSQLSKAALETGLEIRDYRPGVVRPGENYSQLEVQLGCSGPYASLCGFLDRLASLPRLSRVTQIEVAAAEQPPYPVTMSLEVFFSLTEKKN